MRAKQVVATQAQLAAALGKSASWVRDKLSLGMPGTPGQYVVDDCREWIRLHEAEKRTTVAALAEADDMDASGDTSEWLEEYRKWRAKQEELKYAVKRGELVELESVRDFLQQLAGRFRSFGERLEKESAAMRVELDAILEQGKQEVEGLGIARSGDGDSC